MPSAAWDLLEKIRQIYYIDYSDKKESCISSEGSVRRHYMKTRVGFVVFGTHKDGLPDPMGNPFIDEAIISASEKALEARDVTLVKWPVILANKA